MTLPALGESVTEGTVTRWLKSVGDSVEVDEPLLEVSTDKVDTEIPSPVAGTLLEIKVDEDETVEVGAELAVIGDGSAGSSRRRERGRRAAGRGGARARAGARAGAGARARAEAGAGAEARAGEEAPSPRSADGRSRPPRSSDGARRRPPTSSARRRQLRHPAGAQDGRRARRRPVHRHRHRRRRPDPQAGRPGRGRGGVRRPAPAAPAAGSTSSATASAAPSAAPEPAARHDREDVAAAPGHRRRGWWSRCRPRPSSRRSSRSTSPRSRGCATAVKADFLAREGVKLSYLPFFAKAAVDALKVHPALNATFDLEAGEVTYYDRENLAFAVDTEKRPAHPGRQGRRRPLDRRPGQEDRRPRRAHAHQQDRSRTTCRGGTFTITNLGSVGALFDTPIINQPQVAILGPARSSSARS